jgi:hypothetical protein
MRAPLALLALLALPTLLACEAGHESSPAIENPPPLQAVAGRSLMGRFETRGEDDGDSFYYLVSKPEKGSVQQCDASDPTFTYTPLRGTSGRDSFLYVMDDGLKRSTPVRVDITIEEAAPFEGPRFQDVSAASCVTALGTSWGIAWGDLNRDGKPDFFASDHMDPPVLYVNQGDGTFREVSREVVPALGGDAHGAAWADFDNDGDQDLMQLVGGAAKNYLFVNEEGHFELEGGPLIYPRGRGRTPLWLDWDRDGLLDLLFVGEERADAPTVLFRQVSGGAFEEAAGALGEIPPGCCAFAQLLGLPADPGLEIIVAPSPSDRLPYPAVVYAPGGADSEVGSAHAMPKVPSVTDAALEDFDGDLLTDLYLVRGLFRSDLKLLDERHLRSFLAGGPRGFAFKTTGELKLKLSPEARRWWLPSRVWIGSGGVHPEETHLSLDSRDPSTHGFPTGPDNESWISIGYDPESGEWRLMAHRAADGPNYLGVDLETSEPIAGLRAVGFEPFGPKHNRTDRHHVWRGDALVVRNRRQDPAFSEPANCRSVAAGDFDNDADVDLYMACGHPVENLPNQLYANDGSGRFRRVEGAGGAEGSRLGIADAVAVADYDEDGFLDLLVSNGRSSLGFRDDGPYQLFRNAGNENHWIEIDLEGTISNRDGIGARVLIRSAGKTQLRVQDGGMHRGAQDYKRLHFGLSSSAVVEELTVEWPSGISQTLKNVAADRIVRIVEPSDATENGQRAPG